MIVGTFYKAINHELSLYIFRKLYSKEYPPSIPYVNKYLLIPAYPCLIFYFKMLKPLTPNK